MDQTVVLTVLAIVASVLSTGGLVGQFLTFRKIITEKAAEIEKARLETKQQESTSSTEMLALAIDTAKSTREHTGQFQKTLLSRVERLEKDRADDSRRMRNLERDNAECERRYSELDGAFARLNEENEKLRTKISSLESDNGSLRRKVTAIDVTVREIKDEQAESGRVSKSETVLKAHPTPPLLPSGKEPNR